MTHWITLPTALKPIITLRFPDFFLTTNAGEFCGLVDSSVCRASSFSHTSCSNACDFSFVMAHDSCNPGMFDSHSGARLLVHHQWPLLYIWKLNPYDVLFLGNGTAHGCSCSPISIPSPGESTPSPLTSSFAVFGTAGLLIWVPHCSP